MEQSKISQHLKNKQKKEENWQKLQSGLWEKTGKAVVSWTQREMFQGRPSQP